MKKNMIVGFNENGKSKFPHLSNDVFLFMAEIPNSPNWVIVRGFRGKFTLGCEFVENVDDLRVLSEEEVNTIFEMESTEA